MPAFRVSRHRPHQKNRLHWHCKSQGDARRLGLESSKPPQTQGSLAASGPVSRLRKLRSPNPYKPRSPRSAKAENRPNHLVCLVRVLLARQVPIGLFHLRRNEEAKGLLRWRASRSHREKPRSPRSGLPKKLLHEPRLAASPRPRCKRGHGAQGCGRSRAPRKAKAEASKAAALRCASAIFVTCFSSSRCRTRRITYLRHVCKAGEVPKAEDRVLKFFMRLSLGPRAPR